MQYTQIEKIDAEDTWEIRHKVMWPNKDIEYVKLDKDKSGFHYGIIEEGKIISVISLFIEGDRAQFRKFATLVDKQGQGYGSRLLDFVMGEALKLGIRYIWCNAREEKKGFYKRFGMIETEERFEKGGIEYIIMGKILS